MSETPSIGITRHVTQFEAREVSGLAITGRLFVETGFTHFPAGLQSIAIAEYGTPEDKMLRLRWSDFCAIYEMAKAHFK